MTLINSGAYEKTTEMLYLHPCIHPMQVDAYSLDAPKDKLYKYADYQDMIIDHRRWRRREIVVIKY